MFLNYIHNFRGIAILFIVAGHCISELKWDEQKILYNILVVNLQNGTVLFVFIAGFLFQHLKKKYEYKKYLISKLNNVLSPYFIISIPAIIKAVFIFNDKGFQEYPKIYQIAAFYLTGQHLGALWFIPMITLYYLLSPLLIKLDRNNLLYYSLPLLIVISVLITRNENNILQSFFHFLSVYIGGMFCSKYKEKIIGFHKYTLLILFVVFFCITIIDFYFIMSDSRFMFLNFISKMVLCVIFLCLLYKHDGFIGTKFKRLAEMSFGIYFIHQYVISFNSTVLFKAQPGGNIINFLFYFTLTITISSLFLLIARNITGRQSRRIVGY